MQGDGKWGVGICLKSVLIWLGSTGPKKGHDLGDHGDDDGDNVDDVNKSSHRTAMAQVY